MRSFFIGQLVLTAFGFAHATKNSESILFTGATIIGWDNSTNLPSITRNGSLLVRGDRIARISDNIPSDTPNDVEVVDVTGQIITPGFIDTHRHGWQTAFKTLGSDTTLAEYFNRYGEFAAASHFNAEDVYWGQLAGIIEALNAGVTTILDHAHHTWSNTTAYAGLNATIQSGARVFWSYAFHEIPSLNYTVADQIPNFRDIATSDILKGTNVELGIAYDSWGPNPPPAAKEIANLAKEFDVATITTHCLSGAWGIDNLPEDLDAFGILNTSIPVIFSHGSFITAKGAQLLRETNQFLSITPESEMHYGHLHPHSYILQDQAALGVDTHFTFSTDILTQARIWLQQARYHFFSGVLSDWRIPRRNPMSAVQAFTLATRSGGLAMRRPDLGVLQEGSKADLVVWNAADSPALLGWADPVAAIMLHASVGDVLDVMVNGQFFKRNGSLQVNNYPEIKEKFLQSAARVQDLYRNLPRPTMEGQFNGGGYSYADPLTADTRRGKGIGYGNVSLE
ncbi:amidohydrolase family [Fusarium albosuccineum]|uniref:Amidohydrolase family n=1 Tax=Fusarium albosuccineum TaxID=1237068 RepID=A0A8H4L4X3_9HYPO|nr:amidohydrolase family [Fusarium albosuccineum]